MSEDEKLMKEAKNLPQEGRLMHKNWKVRNDGSIDLVAVCNSIWDPKKTRASVNLVLFSGRWWQILMWSVQEKALDALIAYLRASDADSGRSNPAEQRGEVSDSVSIQCLIAQPDRFPMTRTYSGVALHAGMKLYRTWFS